MVSPTLLVVAAFFTVTTAYPAPDESSVGLFRRQNSIPNVPPQCQSSCNPANAIIDETTQGCIATNCCTTSFETDYFNCFLCVGKAANLTDWTQPQAYVDGLVIQCSISGLPIPEKTFPGQDPNRTIATLPGPLSSTSARSTITALSSTASAERSTITALSTSTATNTVTDQPAPSTPGSGAPRWSPNLLLILASFFIIITIH
ncbi:hypothetical protein C8J56DRAFT_1047079 [Mycena floridula]|nr:hypothetical protein C8J56DRAFT_1047079 [Mycena floridula]